MKRRFSKSETEYASVNSVTKRLAALFCASSLLVFSATSCGILEMRDATSEINTREETAAPTLQQAERYSETETEPETESETEPLPPETEPAPEEIKNSIQLALAGGVIIDKAICADAAARAVEGKDYSFLTMYSAIFPLIQDADMSMVTLHTPAADADVFGLSEETYTNMPADSLTALMELGFDVANTAGTKRLDCGVAGMDSTIDNVRETGMMQIGAYKDDIDAGDVRVLEVNGIRVAFVAFTENADDAGNLVLHDLTDAPVAASLITYADLVSDVVVVSVTWDNNTGSAVREEQKNAAQILAEAGADIIVGSDGTGLQKAEWLTTEDGTKTFTAYSLGNLMATPADAASALGGLLTLDVTLAEDGTASLENVVIHPIMKHYDAGQTGYQVTEFFKYNAADTHGAEGMNMADLYTAVYSVVPEEFLPETNG